MTLVISRFVTTRDVIGQAVEWWTYGPYVHVEHILRDGSVIGAYFWHGVMHYKYGQITRDPSTYDDYMLAVQPAQADAIEAFLIAQVGKKYDWRADVGFVSHADWTTHNRWFCSGLEYSAYKSAGISLIVPKGYYTVSPTLLAGSPLWIRPPNSRLKLP